MPKPYVTVLIDTYNHQAFIEDAVNSVLHQDYSSSETEILVVDDGSTDRTPEIVRKFAPRVRLLRKANGGQASAFNTGISEAKGEIIAFLDGDDWWAPGKLSAVAEVFAVEPNVGLVGHGVTEVHQDGRRREEMPRAVSRFRISSVRAASAFTCLRTFLGTSRMAYRHEILRRIGPVPGVLQFEADEYLFTLAGFHGDVLILDQALTFYRLHDRNLYQTSGGVEAIRRKQRIIAVLAESLRARMEEDGISPAIARVILDVVQVEADHLRLIVDGGFPWQTLATELKIMRIFQSDASFWQHLFTCARLLPAAVMPSRTYYHWRGALSRLQFYQRLRQRLMPFPVPAVVKRTDTPAPHYPDGQQS